MFQALFGVLCLCSLGLFNNYEAQTVIPFYRELRHMGIKYLVQGNGWIVFEPRQLPQLALDSISTIMFKTSNFI